MAITLRNTKGSPLTFTELDTNFSDLDTLKAPKASPTFTGTVTGVTAAHVGLGNVTNESKATMFTNPTFTGTATCDVLTATGNVTLGNSGTDTVTTNGNVTINAPTSGLHQLNGPMQWTIDSKSFAFSAAASTFYIGTVSATELEILCGNASRLTFPYQTTASFSGGGIVTGPTLEVEGPSNASPSLSIVGYSGGVGQIRFSNYGITSVGAAGGASALPATPVGYLMIQVGTTNYKVPYYNT